MLSDCRVMMIESSANGSVSGSAQVVYQGRTLDFARLRQFSMREAVIEAIGGKGPVLVITNPPGSVAQDERAKG